MIHRKRRILGDRHSLPSYLKVQRGCELIFVKNAKDVSEHRRLPNILCNIRRHSF